MKLTTSILAFFAAGNSAESNRCTDVQFGEPGTFPLTSLSSYPGSGNTWVRYLIEEFTGFYTGSIYSDNSLFHGGFKVIQIQKEVLQLISTFGNEVRETL